MLTNGHGVTFTSLQSGQTYYFQAKSVDVNGDTDYSPIIYTFTTLGGAAPIIYNPRITPKGGNTATVRLQDVSSDLQLRGRQPGRP